MLKPGDTIKFKCPFCGRAAEAGNFPQESEEDCGVGVIHEMPMCEQFDAMEPDDFLCAVNDATLDPVRLADRAKAEAYVQQLADSVALDLPELDVRMLVDLVLHVMRDERSSCLYKKASLAIVRVKQHAHEKFAERQGTTVSADQHRYAAEILKGTAEAIEQVIDGDGPIPMILSCPLCTQQHVDRDEWATKPHHKHLCANCGHIWEPSKVNTVGVESL